MKKCLLIILSTIFALSLCGCRADDVSSESIAATPATASSLSVSPSYTEEVKSDYVKVKFVETAAYVSAAITEDGDLYTWGNDQAIPVKVMSNVSAVSINNFMTFSGSMMPYGYYLALTKSGDIYAWGQSESGIFGAEGYVDQKTPVKILDHVSYIDAGFNHALAITENGDLYVWGDNTFGQIGNGTTGEGNVLEPVKIMSNVKQASAGYGYTMAVNESDELYGWGANNAGQLGNGKYNEEPYGIAGIILFGNPYDGILTEKTPIKIMDNVQYVNTSCDKTFAITNDENLYGWGNNENGLIGNGEKGDEDPTTIDAVISSPEKIMEDIKTVCVSNYVETAIDVNGSLYAWGYNEWGAVGNGEYGDGDRNTHDAIVLTPEIVMDSVINVSGDTHVLAIKENGELYAWGNNEYGQLGNGEKWNGEPNSAVLFEANPVLITLNHENEPSTSDEPEINNQDFSSLILAQQTDPLINGQAANGIAVADNGVIYISAPWWEAIDTVNKTTIKIEPIEDAFSPICVNQGYIYCLGARNFSLTRINIDGSGSETVFEFPATNVMPTVWFDGTYIFDNNTYEGEKILYRINPETGKADIIKDIKTYYASSDGRNIYFIDLFGRLVCSDINGKNQNIILENLPTTRFLLLGNWIYYIDKEKSLRKVKTNGKEDQDIFGIQADCFNIAGDVIYYANSSDGGKLYRINTDGTNNVLLCDKENIQSIDIAAGWVFFNYSVPNRQGATDGHGACITTDGKGLVDLF